MFDSAIPWPVADQAMPMEFARQVHWSRAPFLSFFQGIPPRGRTWVSCFIGRFFFFFFFCGWNCFSRGQQGRSTTVRLVFCSRRQPKPGASTCRLPGSVGHASLSRSGEAGWGRQEPRGDATGAGGVQADSLPTDPPEEPCVCVSVCV